MTVAHVLHTPTPFALTAGAKTILMAIAPATRGLLVVEMGMSFDGVTASAVPALVELVQSTQATAGTPGTGGAVPTIIQSRGRVTGGDAPTGGANYTAEPTVLTAIRRWYVTPNNGILVVQFPLGREPECDDSGGAVKALGIRINVTAAVNGLAYMEVESNG